MSPKNSSSTLNPQKKCCRNTRQPSRRKARKMLAKVLPAFELCFVMPAARRSRICSAFCVNICQIGLAELLSAPCARARTPRSWISWHTGGSPRAAMAARPLRSEGGRRKSGGAASRAATGGGTNGLQAARGAPTGGNRQASCVSTCECTRRGLTLFGRSTRTTTRPERVRATSRGGWPRTNARKITATSPGHAAQAEHPRRPKRPAKPPTARAETTPLVQARELRGPKVQGMRSPDVPTPSGSTLGRTRAPRARASIKNNWTERRRSTSGWPPPR